MAFKGGGFKIKKCDIEVGDKVKQKKYLISTTGERKWFEYVGIVEKTEYNKLREGWDIYFRLKNGRSVIDSAKNLELIEKDVAKLEGNQAVMEF